MKGKNDKQGESLSLMALDSLVYNLYKSVRGTDDFKPANSSLYGWLSNSQMSMSGEFTQLSNPNAERGSKRLISLIEVLANSEPLFKRIGIILGRISNQQQNQRFAEALIETMGFILEKQKRKKDNFLRLKVSLFSNKAPVKKKIQVEFKQINQVIFGNKLNQITSLLSSVSDQTQMSLLRIYWASNKNAERKQLQGNEYTGVQMLLNLHRYYICNFHNKSELFEQSKHPIYRLLCNNLLLFFTPYFRYFHELISQFSRGNDSISPSTFYESRGEALQKELTTFIHKMPIQLSKLLNELYMLVEQTHTAGESSIGLVKKFLFYSFLLNQENISDLLPRVDPSAHATTYNYILNLFFQSSKTKLESLGKQSLQFSGKLIDLISTRLDSIITIPTHGVLEEEDEGKDFIFTITQPILNSDYEAVALALDQVKFTPMDMKNYQMKREGQINCDSPVYKHFKKEYSIEPQLEMSEEIQLATWMSVGGNCEYHKIKDNKTQTTLKGRAADRLKGFGTISKEKIKQLERLRCQFQQWI